MDRISKFLARLSHDEQKRVMETIEQLIAGESSSLDIKKLKGQKYAYRVRVGDMRIIYTKEKNIRVVAIERRNDKTYRR